MGNFGKTDKNALLVVMEKRCTIHAKNQQLVRTGKQVVVR